MWPEKKKPMSFVLAAWPEVCGLGRFAGARAQRHLFRNGAWPLRDHACGPTAHPPDGAAGFRPKPPAVPCSLTFTLSEVPFWLAHESHGGAWPDQRPSASSPVCNMMGGVISMPTSTV